MTARRRPLPRRLALRLLALGGVAGAVSVAAAGRPSTETRAQAEVHADGLLEEIDPVWAALESGGHVALLRPAEAPGIGDPPEFALGDCSTQRNLSPAGREHAARIGAAFRARGVAVDQVLTSGWCRCVDTAALAFGTAEVWPPLHSFFRDSATGLAQTRAVRERIAEWSGPGTLVLVTHQVNITALTNLFPTSGELAVLAPARGGFAILGCATVD